MTIGEANKAFYESMGVKNIPTSLPTTNPILFSGQYDQTQPTSDAPVTTNAMTREEMTARLELLEAKSDARLSRFEERIDQAIGEMRRDRVDMKDEIRQLATDFKSYKLQIIVALVATGVAVVLGIAAFNATVLSNMVASFEAGRNTASAVAQATEQLNQTQEQLKTIQATLEKNQLKK